MDDPHGYHELSRILNTVEAELRSEGRDIEADEIYRASRFAVGSPSEFLGESRIALQRLLDSGVALRNGTEEVARATIDEITAGFRRVGGQ